MNKNSIRKEIASLIESIKQHSDEISAQQHIPQLELELILHKIEKLHEKSIIFNYLNSLPSEEEIIINPKQIALFENKELQEERSKPAAEEKNTISQQPETIAPEPARPAPGLFEELVDPPEEMIPETIIKKDITDKSIGSKLQKTPIADLKSAIGINEKFQFINELFESNSHEYNIAINQLNVCNSYPEANDYISSLKNIYKWKEDSPVAISFIELIERRFLAG